MLRKLEVFDAVGGVDLFYPTPATPWTPWP